MPEYRLYFLNGDDHIEARHEFAADHDIDALQLAAILADACSDVNPRFMLWCGRHCLWESPADRRPWSMDQWELDRQTRVLDHEEQLKHSHFRLAHSKRLLQASDDLKHYQRKRAS